MEDQTTNEELRLGLFFALISDNKYSEEVLFLRQLRENRHSWFGQSENELRENIDSFLIGVQ